MQNNNQTKLQLMDRSHDRSLTQKGMFALLHLLIVLFCVWLVYFDGWSSIGSLFDKQWQLVDSTRASILIICAFFYWLRHIITLFYLLQRKVTWLEVYGLLSFFALFEIGLVLVGGGAFRNYTISLNWLDLIAVLLLIFGSYLNSFSEIQRKWWKVESKNKGHCYTKGLFSYSMHINFFGDLVLFTGWCLLSASLWTLALPLLMAMLFVFYHIPDLDRYLVNRYGEEFTVYAKNTKKLIPFLY